MTRIHRGFSTFDKIKYRNDPQWQVAIELRSRYPELPFFVDPSHMAGCKDYIQELSQRSLDLGFEGLMIESHCNPSCALSDAKQQLTPDELSDLLYNKITVRDSDSGSEGVEEVLVEDIDLRTKLVYILLPLLGV